MPDNNKKKSKPSSAQALVRHFVLSISENKMVDFKRNKNPLSLSYQPPLPPYHELEFNSEAQKLSNINK